MYMNCGIGHKVVKLIMTGCGAQYNYDNETVKAVCMQIIFATVCHRTFVLTNISVTVCCTTLLCCHEHETIVSKP